MSSVRYTITLHGAFCVFVAIKGIVVVVVVIAAANLNVFLTCMWVSSGPWFLSIFCLTITFDLYKSFNLYIQIIFSLLLFVGLVVYFIYGVSHSHESEKYKHRISKHVDIQPNGDVTESIPITRDFETSDHGSRRSSADNNAYWAGDSLVTSSETSFAGCWRDREWSWRILIFGIFRRSFGYASVRYTTSTLSMKVACIIEEIIWHVCAPIFILLEPNRWITPLYVF